MHINRNNVFQSRCYDIKEFGVHGLVRGCDITLLSFFFHSSPIELSL